MSNPSALVSTKDTDHEVNVLVRFLMKEYSSPFQHALSLINEEEVGADQLCRRIHLNPQSELVNAAPLT